MGSSLEELAVKVGDICEIGPAITGIVKEAKAHPLGVEVKVDYYDSLGQLYYYRLIILEERLQTWAQPVIH